MNAGASWSGSPSIKGSSEPVRMILLAFSLIGISFTWSLETTYGNPYLLSLGLSKSRTALVWIAGPLSGLIMQPIVGVIADRSTSKYGRRRPFMVGGSLIVAACFFILAWSAELVGIFINEGETKNNVTIVLAVLAIYVIDFAINAVQASCRSLIVDTLPTSQQQSGSAWASRVGSFANIIVYCIGSLDLVAILPGWLGGDTQFKKMATIAAFNLLFAVGVTSWAVTERRLLEPASDGAETSVKGVLVTLYKRTTNLPPRIRGICWSQFWGWIGWFPFLFYSSTWVGETYYRYEAPSSSTSASSAAINTMFSRALPGSEENHDALGNIGRLGSTSLVIMSLVTFSSSIIVPLLVRPPSDTSPNHHRHSSTTSTELPKFTPRPPPSLPAPVRSFLSSLSRIPKPTLITTWLISNLMFASIMIWAPMVRSVSGATLLVALCGVPWAISGWAPFAEMGAEINRMSAGSSGSRYTHLSHNNDGVQGDPSYELELEAAISTHPSAGLLGSHPDSHLSTLSDSPTATTAETTLYLSHPPLTPKDIPSTGESSGIYLGVLNVYTTLPQFVGTFISWIVFSILEPSSSGSDSEPPTAPSKDTPTSPSNHAFLSLSADTPNAISICLFIGAICALVAAESVRRLRKIS